MRLAGERCGGGPAGANGQESETRSAKSRGNERPAQAGESLPEPGDPLAPDGAGSEEPALQIGRTVEVGERREEHDRPARRPEGTEEIAQRRAPAPARGGGEAVNGPASRQEIETAVRAGPEHDAVLVFAE